MTIPAGKFIKSKDPIYPEEGVPRELHVSSFNIQIHEVTNGQFAKFIEETGYITDAEKNLSSTNPEAGSALFTTDKESTEGRWHLVNGATWKNPEAINGKTALDHNLPVIHVSHNDAMAYAKWVGGYLPTEIEWEYASSLGLIDPADPYSGAFNKGRKPIANTWQGLFPIIDKGEDGFKGIAPVGCFPPNKLGIYDMIGNVWEWTSTPYDKSSHTIKGGSFLCAPNFCKRYRSAARQPHESDFSTNHIGFRIVTKN